MENKSPLISVYTAVYNSENYIGETIEGVINQTIQDWEYIIVDDGSTDRTLEIIKNYQLKDKRIKLIQNEHSGIPAVGRNTALNYANGIWYANCDGDDIWKPNKLEKQLKVAEREGQSVIIATDRNIINKNGQKIETGTKNIVKRNKAKLEINQIPEHDIKYIIVPHLFLLLQNFVTNSSIFFHSSIFIDVGEFDVDQQTKGGDDYNFLVRAICKDYSIIYIFENLVDYRILENSFVFVTRKTRRKLSTFEMGRKCKNWSKQDIKRLNKRYRALKLEYFRNQYYDDKTVENFIKLQYYRFIFYFNKLLEQFFY